MKLVMEKRLAPSPLMRSLVPVVAAFAALVFCGIFFAVTGRDPFEVYYAMFSGALGSEYGISETIVKMIPLAMCGLGIAIAFRMQIWNIGAEGQFYMGACAASWLPLTYPDLPSMIMLPGMLLLGAAAGGMWGLLAGWFKTKWLVSELITTLMMNFIAILLTDYLTVLFLAHEGITNVMNYIAILWVNYLVYGAWRDPKGLNFPLTAAFSESALLPSFGDLRVHAGIIIVFVLAAVLAVVFRDSRWGYETLVIGSNPTAARYAGINIPRNVLLVMLLSGAVCGMGGMIEVSGIVGKLQPGISPGYGYTAIIVAWLARLHPAAIIVVAFLFAIIHVGGFMVQTLGIPSAVATMLQGAILFFVVGADIFTNYQLRLIKNEGGEESE